MQTRIVTFGIMIILLLPLSTLAQPKSQVSEPGFIPHVPAVRLAPTVSTVATAPNTAVVQTITVFNEGIQGDPIDTYTMTFPTHPAGWLIIANPNPVANVIPGNSRAFDVLINIPASTTPGTYTVIVKATAVQSDVEAYAMINVIVERSPYYLPFIAASRRE